MSRETVKYATKTIKAKDIEIAKLKTDNEELEKINERLEKHYYKSNKHIREYQMEISKLKKQLKDIKYLDAKEAEGILGLLIDKDRKSNRIVDERDIYNTAKVICNKAIPDGKVIAGGEVQKKQSWHGGRVGEHLDRTFLTIGGKEVDETLSKQIGKVVILIKK